MLIRKHKKAQETNRDRYLITYADLITLLLGLFVILYAASQVDSEKFKAVSEALSVYFKSESVTPGQGALEGGKKILPEPVIPPAKKNMSITDVQEEVEEKLKFFLTDSSVTLSRAGNGLLLTLPEKFLFPSGKAVIRTEGITMIDSLANALRGLNLQITVDGHTDTDPIRTFQYESNWHLSVDRALNVGYSLITRGVSQANMIIRGFGAQRPMADNFSAEGKKRNRRVEIIITELPPEAPSTSGYESQAGSDTLNE